MRWRVPNMWEGGECWIIGGGTSIPEQFGVPSDLIDAVANGDESMKAFSPYLAPIHAKHCIGINMAFLLGDWVEMMFFADQRFFLDNRQLIADYSGLKVTCYPGLRSVKFQNDNLKHLLRDDKKPRGISDNPMAVCWNGNSGAAAISIAANAGAKRIILLGFDMKRNDKNRTHFHGEYATKGSITSLVQSQNKKLPFGKHLLGFTQIAADAKARGIEIINASLDSAIQEFPKIPVKELLKS